jgi:hypothetical protein
MRKKVQIVRSVVLDAIIVFQHFCQIVKIVPILKGIFSKNVNVKKGFMR